MLQSRAGKGDGKRVDICYREGQGKGMERRWIYVTEKGRERGWNEGGSMLQRRAVKRGKEGGYICYRENQEEGSK